MTHNNGAARKGGSPFLELARWTPKWTIFKYDEKGTLYEISVITGNKLLNVGINEIWDLLTGVSSNHFDNTNTLIGVGNSSTTADASQTDLLGTSKTYKGMDAGYPTSGTSQKFVCRSTFGADDANHDWQEFVIKNNASGKVLNRLVSNQGTKAQGQTWVIIFEVSLV